LGIGSTRPLNKKYIVDLETVDGHILSDQAKTQLEPIEGLENDWSRIVDEEGNQLATVGHHFQLSATFNKFEIDRISREGTCLACHKEIPEASLSVSFLHHVAKYTGGIPTTASAHNQLVNKIVLTSPWGQMLLNAAECCCPVCNILGNPLVPSTKETAVTASELSARNAELKVLQLL